MEVMMRNEIWCFAIKHRRWYHTPQQMQSDTAYADGSEKRAGHNHSYLNERFCSLLLCGQKIIIIIKKNWKGKRGKRALREWGLWKRGTAFFPVLPEAAEAPSVMHVGGLGRSERLRKPHMGALCLCCPEMCKELRRKKKKTLEPWERQLFSVIWKPWPCQLNGGHLFHFL